MPTSLPTEHVQEHWCLMGKEDLRTYLEDVGAQIRLECESAAFEGFILAFAGFTQVSYSGLPALRWFSIYTLPRIYTSCPLHLGVHVPVVASPTTLGAPGSSFTRE